MFETMIVASALKAEAEHIREHTPLVLEPGLLVSNLNLATALQNVANRLLGGK